MITTGLKAMSWGSFTKFLSSESFVFIKEFKVCKREKKSSRRELGGGIA